MFDLQLKAALGGDLDVMQAGVMDAMARAGHDTMHELKDRGVSRLRASVREAGLGDRVANTWRGEVYPKRGYSPEPALFIWSKAPELINAHQGETIHGRDGGWLAIPVPDSPAENFPARGMSKVEYARQRFGDRLFVIPGIPGARPAILAVEGVGQTKTGRLTVRKKTKSGNWGKGTMTAFLFWLVPQVTLKRVLDVDADFEWIEDMFYSTYPRLLGENLRKYGIS